MRRVLILRGRSTDDGTPGRLSLEGSDFVCDTLELPWNNNRRGVSCTIADTYRAWRWFSPRFSRWVYRFEDKHGRKDCLIHHGNFAGEVRAGERTDVHGCTLVGRGYGQIERSDGGGLQMGIRNSVATLTTFMMKTEGDELEVTYQWAEGCEPDDLTNALED